MLPASASLRILIFMPDPRATCPGRSSSGWKGTVVEIVYARVAAIDVGKKEIAVTIGVPGEEAGRRSQQTRKFRTFYQVLRQMVGWLVEQGVTHAAMEATGVYWKPVFHALGETDTVEVVLVNARHVKNVPGRKTDLLTELAIPFGSCFHGRGGGGATVPARDHRGRVAA